MEYKGGIEKAILRNSKLLSEVNDAFCKTHPLLAQKAVTRSARAAVLLMSSIAISLVGLWLVSDLPSSSRFSVWRVFKSFCNIASEYTCTAHSWGVASCVPQIKALQQIFVLQFATWSLVPLDGFKGFHIPYSDIYSHLTLSKKKVKLHGVFMIYLSVVGLDLIEKES